MNFGLAELIFGIGTDRSDPVSYSPRASAGVKVLNIIRCSQHIMPLQVRCVPFPPVLSPGRLPAAPQAASCPLAPEWPQPMGRPAGIQREGKMRSDSTPPSPIKVKGHFGWAVFFRLKVSYFSRQPNLCNALSFWIPGNSLSCTFRPRGSNHDH